PSDRLRGRHLPLHAAAPLTRRFVCQRDGRGPGIVMAVWIMAAITFREAARKKILWALLLAGHRFPVGLQRSSTFAGGGFRHPQRAPIPALPGSARHAHGLLV